MREIPETTDRTTSARPGSVVLATLLLAIRGLLLIALHFSLPLTWPNGPDIIAIAVTVPPWFLFAGLIDIWSAGLLWRRRIRGWRCGVMVSVVILLLMLLGLTSISVLLLSAEGALFIVIGILSMIEMIVLLTPSVRQYCRR